jgi:hypothetical protein
MGTDIARLHQPHQESSGDKSHLFQKGHQKVGGRRAGTRNRVGGDLRLAIVAAIHETGYMTRIKGKGLVRRGYGPPARTVSKVLSCGWPRMSIAPKTALNLSMAPMLGPHVMRRPFESMRPDRLRCVHSITSLSAPTRPLASVIG